MDKIWFFSKMTILYPIWYNILCWSTFVRGFLCVKINIPPRNDPFWGTFLPNNWNKMMKYSITSKTDHLVYHLKQFHAYQRLFKTFDVIINISPRNYITVGCFGPQNGVKWWKITFWIKLYLYPILP